MKYIYRNFYLDDEALLRLSRLSVKAFKDVLKKKSDNLSNIVKNMKLDRKRNILTYNMPKYKKSIRQAKSAIEDIFIKAEIFYPERFKKERSFYKNLTKYIQHNFYDDKKDYAYVV